MAARFEFPNPPHTRPCRLERVHTPTAHLFRKCSNGAFCTSKQHISPGRNDRVRPQTRGIRGRPERAATPLAHALYTPLSLPPYLPTPGRLFGHGVAISTEKYTEGLHRSVRRGGQFSTRANLGHASNTKGPLRRKTCTQKTAMTPVVATIS